MSVSKQSKLQHQSSCQLPQVPVRSLAADINPNRESLIRYIEKKWVNFTVEFDTHNMN